MPPRSYQSRVQHVAKGSPVSAGNTGRTTRQLEARDNYLKEVVDAMEAGRALMWREQTIDPDLLEGQACFWNATTQRYEQALAAVETDAVTGLLVTAESSACIGLLYSKSESTKGDIVTMGVVKYATLANSVLGDVTPGRYYLSADAPGYLVRQRPGVSAPVCYIFGPQNDCETDIWVLVAPQMKDFLDDHTHYKRELICLPAGTHVPPEVGVAHSVTDGDEALPGWLPADHESFGEHAPAGAKFGYNLAADPGLDRLWPPIPPDQAVMFWDRGDGTLKGATEIQVNGTSPVVIVDQYGIWWMSDCYGDVPWPTEYDSTASSSLSVDSVSSSAGDDCPRTDRMRLVLAFTHMLFDTSATVVTSLQAATDEPIEFVNCDGVPARTGDLFARLILSAMIDADEYYGGQVFKELVGPGLKFGTGYVTEGIIAGSDNVVLTSTRQRRLTPGNAATALVHQGIITLDVNLEPGEREFTPQILKLGDALEREYKGVVYIGMPAGRDSSVRMRFNVPTSGLPTNPKFFIRAWVFGRGSAGPLPEITAGYYRLVVPTEDVPTVIAEGDTAIEFDVVTPSAALAADSVMLVASEEFTVAAGDTVMVELSRASDAEPDYDNDVGLVRVVGILVSGE